MEPIFFMQLIQLSCMYPYDGLYMQRVIFISYWCLAFFYNTKTHLMGILRENYLGPKYYANKMKKMQSFYNLLSNDLCYDLNVDL